MNKYILRVSAIAISSLALTNVAYAGGHGGNHTSVTPQAGYEGGTMHEMPCMDGKGLKPVHNGTDTQMMNKDKMEQRYKTMHQEREMREYMHENNMRYNQ